MVFVATVIFWLSALVIAYTYVGYALLVALLARWRARSVHRAESTPSVAVLIAAYNEEACIAAKIENTLAQDYPAERLRVVVVADGSTDRTPEIVAGYAARGVRLLFQPQRQGKPAAIRRAFPLTEGEVIVFSDANSYFAPQTVRALVRNLADPAVGGVSGAKHVKASLEGAMGHAATGAGEGLYWRYEAFLKRCDSAISAVMGVPGEVWAARREAFIPAEADSLIEDFVASMRMVGAGWRVVYEPEAVAYEVATPSLRAEWVRRTRIAAGGWQAFFQLRPALRRAPAVVIWQYLSHRMLRWMVTPALFVTLLLANLALLAQPFYLATLVAQGAFYALAGAGWFLAARGQRPRGALLPFYLCLLNAAALVGGWRYLRGQQPVLWARVR